MKKTTGGFTIVELLIVIVVIAILAAITIVAYNGIQDRAKASTVQSMVTTISKKVQSYKVVTGQYPSADELIYNRAPGSTVNGSGPAEAKVDGYNITFANQSNGTNTVRYVINASGTCAWLDWWDYGNNRVSTLTSSPSSARIDC
ncbi:prepilin-type N-terminal cleavage/methylation domain-containing protein [Candidatus Saccharibacteria bacterium]|nr:prepilin-type N-terminal cleavage/methylation domain-containing protein [Candidatus Saccharibacteria bacterium]